MRPQRQPLREKLGNKGFSKLPDQVKSKVLNSHFIFCFQWTGVPPQPLSVHGVLFSKHGPKTQGRRGGSLLCVMESSVPLPTSAHHSLISSVLLGLPWGLSD